MYEINEIYEAIKNHMEYRFEREGAEDRTVWNIYDLGDGDFSIWDEDAKFGPKVAEVTIYEMGEGRRTYFDWEVELVG